MEAIEIRNLTRTQGNFKLDIDKLDIKQGYITGFIGANGAGKSTTIKLILDMIKKENGSVKIFGEEYDNDKKHITEEIGYMGDINGFYTESKLKNIKKYISKFYKNWDEELYKRYISLFSLDENKRYIKLSQGQRKQFELSILLAHNPKLIILDEPTANLDPLVRNTFLEIIQEHIEKHEATVFYSTHITSDLDKVCDYVVLINNGKILLSEEKDYLLENYKIVRGSNDLIDSDTESCFVHYDKKSFGFEGLANYKEAYEMFGNEATYDKPSLEDLMMHFTRGTKYE